MRAFPSGFSYLVLGLIVVVDAVWLAVTGISLRTDLLSGRILLLAALAAGVLASAFLLPGGTRVADYAERIGLVVQGLVFVNVAWMACHVLNYVSMTTAIPYADAMLASWDAALGFDWLAYFRLVVAMPVTSEALRFSYNLFMPAALISVAVLALSGDLRRCGFLIEAFFITAVCCIAVGMFFPAEGAPMHFLRGSVPDSELLAHPGLYHLDALQSLRSRSVTSLDPQNLPGLVTFPSFHTAGGIVIAVSFWRTLWFWPAGGYALVMIASTPIFGAHYLVDLIAGTAVAAAVVWGLARTQHYRSVLGSGTTRRRPPRPSEFREPFPGGVRGGCAPVPIVVRQEPCRSCTTIPASTRSSSASPSAPGRAPRRAGSPTTFQPSPR